MRNFGKILVTVLCLLSSVPAFGAGGFMTFEYEYENNKNQPHDSINAFSIAPGYKFDNGFKVDLKFEGEQDSLTKDMETKLEARVRYDQKLFGPVKGTLRLGIGEKFTQQKNYPYYTIEPGLVWTVVDNTFDLNVSMRHRDAFDRNNNYNTNTWKFGAAYKISKQHEVGVKYFEKFVDDRTCGFELVYTYSF